MTDSAIDVRWCGIDGKFRKIRFEPICNDYLRIEYEWTRLEWREIGCEPVEEVAIETADGILENEE